MSNILFMRYFCLRVYVGLGFIKKIVSKLRQQLVNITYMLIR